MLFEMNNRRKKRELNENKGNRKLVDWICSRKHILHRLENFSIKGPIAEHTQNQIQQVQPWKFVSADFQQTSNFTQFFSKLHPYVNHKTHHHIIKSFLVWRSDKNNKTIWKNRCVRREKCETRNKFAWVLK